MEQIILILEVVAGGNLQSDCGNIRHADLSVCHPAVENADSRLPSKHGSVAEHGSHHHIRIGTLLRVLRHLPERALREKESVVGRASLVVSEPAALPRGFLFPDRVHLHLRGHAVRYRRQPCGRPDACSHSGIGTIGKMARPGKRPASGGAFFSQSFRLHPGPAHHSQRKDGLCSDRRTDKLECGDTCPVSVRRPVYRRLRMEPNQIPAHPETEQKKEKEPGTPLIFNY